MFTFEQNEQICKILLIKIFLISIFSWEIRQEWQIWFVLFEIEFGIMSGAHEVLTVVLMTWRGEMELNQLLLSVLLFYDKIYLGSERVEGIVHQ